MINEKQTMENIIKVLKDSKMSVEEISKNLDISISTYNSWINYESVPRIGDVVKISEIFHKSVDDIIVLQQK